MLNQVYLMCTKFGQRPCHVLFPDLVDYNAQMCVDTIVFNIGYEREVEQHVDELHFMAGVEQRKKANRGLLAGVK